MNVGIDQVILYSIKQLRFGRYASTSESDGSGILILFIIGIIVVIAVSLIIYGAQKKGVEIPNPQVNLDFCPHCGIKIHQSTSYCDYCGQLIKPE